MAEETIESSESGQSSKEEVIHIHEYVEEITTKVTCEADVKPIEQVSQPEVRGIPTEGNKILKK